MYKPIAKAMGKDKFRPPQLRNCLVDFDEIRTLELPLKTMHHTKFHFDPMMWVVLADTQFATDTEEPISGVHVSPGSAETLVRRGGITNHHSIAYCLSTISVKNYQNRLVCV